MGGIFKRSGNGKRDFGKANLIIFLFASAHALLCYLLHDTSVGDGLFLTILTIAMVFCLIRFYGSPLDVFLGLAFLSCFAGFYFGTSVGDYLPAMGVFNNMIVTFVTTEILGLATVLVVARKNLR
jgi:hypothetical protein